jgi:peptidoglycan/xylan/chitin deacetylase (PgdA/CDA1 family)
LFILDLAGKLAAILLFRTSLPWAVALFFIPDLVVVYHVFIPNAQGLVRVHRRFRTPRRVVWLTIDDGPDPQDTRRILELLAEHGAKATFFVIGANVAANPGLAREIADAGHEVAHHTYSHPMATFWCASPARVARELDEATRVLRAEGIEPRRFRAPVGIKSLWLGPAIAARNLAYIGWSARGLEVRCRSAGEVADLVTRGIRPGAILLLHEGIRVPAALRVAAIRSVLERLKALGYGCVVPAPEQLMDA